MPGFDPSYTKEIALREQAEIENALFDGVPISLGRSGHKKGVYRIAAQRLGATDLGQSLRRRHGMPGEPGSVYGRWGLLIEWTMFRPIVKTPPPPEPLAATAVVSETPAIPPDPIEVRRLKDEVKTLRSRLNILEPRLIAAEDLRSGVLGLASLPPAPVSFPSRATGKALRETIILPLGDLHWGEHVDIAQMDGLNSYSIDIARKRLGRWTNAVVDLGTKHWSGPPPDRIILTLLGDLISGALHPELAKTDELKPIPAVRDVADHLRHAITTIKANIDCPIEIISLPGNHGRSTIKPETKEVAATSYDMLASDFLEMSLRGVKGITFFAPPSVDALFSVYGWRVLFTHGDRIGSRGGQGFIGPAATAARGFKRIVADYAARGVHLDLIVIGHFHTGMQLEEGFVNDSLIGPSEYSRDGRFRPHPAMQLFFTMHPMRKITQVRWIEVGHPDEGSLYVPPEVDRALRPRFRVQAPSIRA